MTCSGGSTRRSAAKAEPAAKRTSAASVAPSGVFMGVFPLHQNRDGARRRRAPERLD